MTTLKKTIYTMPAADLGPENCNPDFHNVEYIHAGYQCTENLTDEEKRYIGKGMIDTILPYTIQDNYNRHRTMKDVPAIELENDFLKAVFLPTLGGRLWSLFDKKNHKELLYVNSAFQPANLAIRNAWFSGGVEWNFCIKGHNPLTCAPLFVEFAQTETGEPVLRMYEYERIRKVVISVEAYLPADEGVLYFRNSIENTEAEEKYAYWWSNIAVPETKKTRVIVPASDSFICYYNEGSYVLDKASIPEYTGVDFSYPINAKRSQDFFYKIPDNELRWIASVEDDGKGLLQFSQSKLKGRKLFLWGQGTGGKHWPEFLSNPGESYIEIQAGLAHTQLEHIPMKGKEVWSWVEAYCGVECAVDKVHGNWDEAQSEILRAMRSAVTDETVRSTMSSEDMDVYLENKFPKSFSERMIVQNGSGWGYIENATRRYLTARDGVSREKISARMTFPSESVTEKEKEWLTLLETGSFVERKVEDIPCSYMVSKEWTEIAEKAAKRTENWYAWLQLGVIYHANGMIAEAKEALEKSVLCKQNAWAYRNLAMIEKNAGNLEKSAKLIVKALALGCLERGLVINSAQLLIGAGKSADWLELYKLLPDALQKDGRILYYTAVAYVETDQPQQAAEIITPDFEMCDIKEGEASLSQLWQRIYSKLSKEKVPLPYSLDFRMH